MPLYLNNGSTSFIEFQSNIPEDYTGTLLPGGKFLYSAKDSFQLIIQEIVTDLFTIRLNVFKFFKKISIESLSHKSGLHSRILLQENLRHRIKGAGTIYLREGEYTMLWSGDANCKTKFEKDKEYKILDIFYSPGLVQQLTSFFPDLAEVTNNNQTKLLVKSPCFITPAMQGIVQQILDCPFDYATRMFYFDLKVREFLFLMLEHAYKPARSRYRFTPYETSCIIKAHKLLLEDISKKPLSIQMLAIAVAINEFKLKAGFKQLFGLTIFDCLHEARMEKARELLLTTNEPIKYICVLSGYPRMTNFITAFRKRFGYTPGSMRRK